MPMTMKQIYDSKLQGFRLNVADSVMELTNAYSFICWDIHGTAEENYKKGYKNALADFKSLFDLPSTTRSRDMNLVENILEIALSMIERKR